MFVFFAVDPSAVLLDTATTAVAFTRSLRTCSTSTVALLWALAECGPIDPVVTTSSVLDAAALGTAMPSSRSLTMPPSGGSTTWGVGPTLTPAALTETPNASPLTLLACVFVVAAPTSNPVAARLTTYCRIR